MEKGRIFNIQRFCVHDGAGIRTVVFFKGCNLRCFWCHNPEGISAKYQIQFFANKCIHCGKCIEVCKFTEKTEKDFSQQLSLSAHTKTAIFTNNCLLCGNCAEVCYAQARLKVGQDITAEKLAQELLKDKEVFSDSGGGVTFSGGEALLQSEFLVQLCEILKSNNVSVIVETAACVKFEKFEPLLKYLEALYCDLKAVSPALHKEGTGADNALILENLKKLSAKKVNLTIRTPVIPQFNDTQEEMSLIADFLLSLPVVPKFELLPFHGACSGKYKAMNMEFCAKDLQTPSREKMDSLAKIFSDKGINIKY